MDHLNDHQERQLRGCILKSGRVVFNIEANHYRLVALIQYQAGVLMIRFFGSHEEHDAIDAEKGSGT